MNLGEKIYELRTASNLSQGDVADALDVCFEMGEQQCRARFG